MVNGTDNWGMGDWFGDLCLCLVVAAVVGVACLVLCPMPPAARGPPTDTPSDAVRRPHAVPEVAQAGGTRAPAAAPSHRAATAGAPRVLRTEATQ